MIRSLSRAILCAVVFALALTTDGVAQGRGRGHDKDKDKDNQNQRSDDRDDDDEGWRRGGSDGNQANRRHPADRSSDRRDGDIVLRERDGRIVIIRPRDIEHRYTVRRNAGPSFCRSGAGHPVHGRQWCLDKGWGVGSSGRVYRERDRLYFWDGDDVIVVPDRFTVTADRGFWNRLVNRLAFWSD